MRKAAERTTSSRRIAKERKRTSPLPRKAKERERARTTRMRKAKAKTRAKARARERARESPVRKATKAMVQAHPTQKVEETRARAMVVAGTSGRNERVVFSDCSA